MRSLFRGLSNRSTPAEGNQPQSPSSDGLPALSPVTPSSSGPGGPFPWVPSASIPTTDTHSSAITARPIPASTASTPRPPFFDQASPGSSLPIPVPLRRQSEPPERWARPTLPSYAVSRGPTDQANADIPTYEAALSHGISSTPRGTSLEAEDEAVLSWSAREYFGHRTGSLSAGAGSLPVVRELPTRSASNGDSGTGSSAAGNDQTHGDGELSESNDIDEDQADDPLVPRRVGLLGGRRNTTGGHPGFALHPPDQPYPSISTSLGASGLRSGALGDVSSYIDLPAPTSEPPVYSPSLGHDEVRLISTVHLADDHPAAAFFNAIARAPPRASSSTAPDGAEADSATGSVTTGGKKLRVKLNKHGERTNSNGTGPLFIRLTRGDTLAGEIEIGKVDHAYGLEVAIIGVVNVQYYVRGQYTVVDTLPLARRKAILFPPQETSRQAATSPDPDIAVNGANTGPAPGSEVDSAAFDVTPAPAEDTSDMPKGKDGRPLIKPGSTFSFSLKMPSCHYRVPGVELPPACSLQQIGLQASVEYMLKIKMSRKGWRWNDEITIPILYQPRAYIPPARLRSLTTDDPFNPGWRTISLHGGKPVNKNPPALASSPTSLSGTGPGVNVTLLLPSPPIMFVAAQGEFPTFPFHLHFHSELPHPLGTFSNPAESKFIIRMTRVAMMRIGMERETRRLEIPTKVELWQEGGERITLSPLGEGVVGGTVGEGRRGSAAPVTSGAAPVGSPDGGGTMFGGLGAPDGPNGGSLRRYSSSGSTSTNDRRRVSLSELLRRRNSSATGQAPAGQSPTTTTGPSASDGPSSGAFSPGSLPSALPPVIREDQAEHRSVTHVVPNSPRGSALAPLSLSSTDVHLQGSLTIDSTDRPTAEIMRRLVPSFNTPEITLTYIVEVTIVPRKGAVKEAFGHVWGGGLIEVVLGQGVGRRMASAEPAESAGTGGR